jgi:hypothetical protein
VERWTLLLALSPTEVAAAITAHGEAAAALRHVSPFAGVLTARDRWSIWRKLRSERDDPRAA